MRYCKDFLTHRNILHKRVTTDWNWGC